MENREFHRKIDISNIEKIFVGTRKDCHLAIRSDGPEKVFLSLSRDPDAVHMFITEGLEWIRKNGQRVSRKEAIYPGDYLSVSRWGFYFGTDGLWTEEREDLVINFLPYQDISMRKEYPLFCRNVRIHRVLDTEPIEVLDPPALLKAPEENPLLRLLPSLGMLAAAGWMASHGGTVMLLFSGISALTGVGSAVMGFWTNRKRFQREKENRQELYEAYIYQKTNQILEARKKEKEQLEEIYLPIPQTLKRVRDFSMDLFDRTVRDADFLCLYLGTGEVLSQRGIRWKQLSQLETPDALQEIPQRLAAQYAKVTQGSVVCNLKEAGALGIIGREEDRFSLFQNMVLDLAARHYYGDVQMVFLALPEHAERLHWLRFLPHLHVNGLPGRGIAADEDRKTEVFEFLFQELSQREEEKEHAVHLLLFFYDDCGFRSHPVSRFLEQAEELGVTFLLMSDDRSGILPGVHHVIDLMDQNSGFLIPTADIYGSCHFTFPGVSHTEAEEAVRLLAPVYTEEVSLEQALPKTYSMLEMLGIHDVKELNLYLRWKEAKVYESLAVPIGVARDGLVYLDLHEHGHGPHGLVAGTTGSGKSELLLTIILAAAVTFHPYDLRFLIIDFKGGGMVNEIRGLPHLAGAITNIEGKETARSLQAMRAEILKRERLFDAAGVNHIDQYVRAYKEGKLTVPLAHLIVIVDEFAELRAEQPEFMKELISTARVGRSLGIHLILATQKPSGQVSEQIWSNSRFRICLKVQDPSDSREVLKSPVAAQIREAGRAYLQVGNQELFTLFQSAYCKGTVQKSSEKQAFKIHQVSDYGKKTLLYEQKPTADETDIAMGSPVDALIAHIQDTCRNAGIENLPDILRPPLPDKILFSHAAKWQKPEKSRDAEMGFFFRPGIVDVPEEQDQPIWKLDLRKGNLLIVGTAQSGKTNLLKILIREAAEQYTPEEVQIFILDFAAALRPYAELPHVGGVILASDEERMKRFFYMLESELAKRKLQMEDADETTGQFPYFFLVVDQLTALKELYLSEEDTLLRVLQEGPKVGIYMAASLSRVTGFGYRYLACFPHRIALNCIDSGEYQTLFEHVSIRPEPVPGRGLIEMRRKIYECQIYLADPEEKAWIAKLNRTYPGTVVRTVPSIPKAFPAEYLFKQMPEKDMSRFSFPMGISYISAEVLTEDLSSIGVLFLTGKEEKGKTNYLHYLLSGLLTRYPGQCRVYVMDDMYGSLKDLQKREEVSCYSTHAEDAVSCIFEMEKILKERYECFSAREGTGAAQPSSELLVLAIRPAEAIQTICADPKALQAYRSLIGRYRSFGVFIVLCCEEMQLTSYHAPEIIREMREDRNCMFFGTVKHLKLPEVPLADLKKMHNPRGPLDALYLRGGDIYDLKVPLSKERDMN